jgi:hypothetical protein
MKDQEAKTCCKLMFDRNSAVKAFSAPFGNNAKRLEVYCRESGFTGDVAQLLESFNSIQNKIIDEIWRRSEARPLAIDEMIAVTRKHVAKYEPWINETGIDGLFQYIAWMCHHEGLVKFPEPTHQSRAWWQIW